MSQLNLSIATTDYDHFRDFRLGFVKAEGVVHKWLNLGHHERFARFIANREFDLSELSFAKFATQVTRTDSDIIGLPVVCSRLFRFGAFYVNKRSKIRTVTDLKGKKIGSPEWAHSAAAYMRGWMHNDMGVKLTDVHWVQAGANAAGREEKVELKLPKGLKLTRVADRSLSELLAKGEIDHVRRRSVSLRNRGKPRDLGTDGALRLAAGHRAPPIQARGNFSRRHDDQGCDLTITVTR